MFPFKVVNKESKPCIEVDLKEGKKVAMGFEDIKKQKAAEAEEKKRAEEEEERLKVEEAARAAEAE